MKGKGVTLFNFGKRGNLQHVRDSRENKNRKKDGGGGGALSFWTGGDVNTNQNNTILGSQTARKRRETKNMSKPRSQCLEPVKKGGAALYEREEPADLRGRKREEMNPTNWK